MNSKRLAIVITLFLTLTAGMTATTQAKVKKKVKQKSTANSAYAPVKDVPGLPRVLLIGDSISIGYTLPVRKIMAGQANIHRPATNCGPSKKGLEELDKWLAEGPWDVIHFNFGLHDLKTVNDGKYACPIEQYEKNLQAIVSRLKETGAKLIWCSTTPVPIAKTRPSRSDRDVVAYNKIAEKIMKANDIPIDDLYAFALPQLEKIQIPANVHFTKKGSEVLAGKVAESIKKALVEKKKQNSKSDSKQ
ncbi:MAG: SGNH/GDSL hydrolase family protein [Pirellulales bacterium]|nr:SGNH/GDSL hydrolase family protein [Pirellulales bacterium]